MEKFDVMSFYGHENEELQKEYERMFCNMTQEEKQLLIKDISARVLYGVKVNIERDFPNNPQIVERIGCDGEIIVQNILAYDIYYYKPYLRPLSTMTGKECKELGDVMFNFINNETYYTHKQIDWLNAHHFDYRGLIEKGFALEAPEGMYKTE